MQYTELDIKLDQIVPFSEIIITKLDQINFEAFQEYDEGVKCYINSEELDKSKICLLYTSPSPRDATLSRMPSSA